MPCIGPLHRPRGGPKPDFDFAYLSHPPIVIFRYAVVGVMEELKTSLAVLQVFDVLALAGS